MPTHDRPVGPAAGTDPAPAREKRSAQSGLVTGPGQFLGLQHQVGNRTIARWMKGQPGRTSARPLPPVPGSDRVQRQVALQRDGPDEVLKAEAAELAMVPSGAGGSIRLSDPLHDANNPDEKPSITPMQIAAVAPRSTGADQRKGFDTRGEALAFAVARAGGTGAGVVQRGKFFFVVTFVPNPDFVRTKVYAYTAAQGILSAVGNDGFVFDPAVTRYEPDAERTRLLKDPSKELTGTASPADLAQMAGIPPPGSKPGDAAETAAGQQAVDIPPGQQEAFIRQYLVARGMAMLNANEAAALKLMEDFKPTSPGDEKTPGTGLSGNAKTMIDNARAVAADLSSVQDQEIALEKLISDRDWERSVSGSSLAKWTAEGVTKTLGEWKTDLATRQKDIAARKDEIFAKNAVVAQLVQKREPDSTLQTDMKRVMDSPAAWLAPLPKLGWEIYKAVSPDNTATKGPLKTGTDEEVRQQMQTKIDAVVKAVREVKSRTLAGDLKFLVSMPRLFDAAKADFARIKVRNSMLGHELETIRVQTGAQVDVKQVIEIAGTALQLIGFFFPPLEFMGAVMTFGVAAARMGEALEERTVADAATTPDQAMMDPDKAQKKLSEATLGLATESVNLGMSLGGAAKAIEAGKVPTELKKAAAGGSGVAELMKLSTIEREAEVAASISKVGEAMTVREAGGYATVRAALPPSSPSMRKLNAWQNGVVAQMTQAVGEHQIAKMAGADVGAAGLRPAESAAAAGGKTAAAAGPPPTLPALTASDVELAKASLAKSVGGKPEDAARLTGVSVDDPAALTRYMEAAPPPALTPEQMRRAMAQHGMLAPTLEGMQHLEGGAMKAYLTDMKAMEQRWGSGAAGRLSSDPIAKVIVQKRCDRLAEAINNALRRSRVPEVKVGWSDKLGAGSGGHFNMNTWRIEFTWDTLSRDLAAGDSAFLNYAMFHEGTHADQWWGVARMMATDGKDAAAIRTATGMERRVADEAVAAAKQDPLRVTSAEAAPYREIYRSVAGSVSIDRTGIINAYHAATTRKTAAEAAMKTAHTELEAAETAWKAQMNAPASTARTDAQLEYQARQRDWTKAKSDLDASTKDYDAKFAAYMNLPEELQAQAAERRLRQAGGPQL